MKKIYFILFLLSAFSILNSQELIIKELIVSRAIVNVEDILEEYLEEGPLILFNISISNNTDTVINISPSTSNIYVTFEYGGRIYNKDAECFPDMSITNFKQREEIVLKPLESFDLHFSLRIFLGTSILENFDNYYYNYSKQLIQVLPTIKIVFKNQKLKITSKSINRVKLAEDYEYTPR